MGIVVADRNGGNLGVTAAVRTDTCSSNVMINLQVKIRVSIEIGNAGSCQRLPGNPWYRTY